MHLSEKSMACQIDKSCDFYWYVFGPSLCCICSPVQGVRIKFSPSQHYVQVNCQLKPLVASLAMRTGSPVLLHMGTNKPREHMNTMKKREVSALTENRTWSFSLQPVISLTELFQYVIIHAKFNK
jgi:hypothetical protein